MSNPTSIISKYIEEVIRLDREATKGPWDYCCDNDDFAKVGIRLGLPGSKAIAYGLHAWGDRLDNDFSLVSHYRTAAPKLAEALEVAIKAIEKLHGASMTSGSIAWPALDQISHLLSDETKGEGNV